MVFIRRGAGCVQRPEILRRAAWEVRQKQHHPGPVTGVPAATVVQFSYRSASPPLYVDDIRNLH